MRPIVVAVGFTASNIVSVGAAEPRLGRKRIHAGSEKPPSTISV